MNVVENMDSFLQDVRQGHWDSVLKTIQPLHLNDAVQIDLYEQVLNKFICNNTLCNTNASLYSYLDCIGVSRIERIGRGSVTLTTN